MRLGRIAVNSVSLQRFCAPTVVSGATSHSTARSATPWGGNQQQRALYSARMSGPITVAISRLDGMILEASSQGTPLSTVASTPTATTNGTATVPASGRVLSILIELEQVLTDALQQAFPGLEERALVAPCRDAKFGDYQCNNAMALFAKMKGKEGAPKNPRAVGEAIQAALKESPAIKSTSIAGPGFVNLVLHDEWLAARVDHMLQSGIACWAPQLKEHRVVVDFSSPNVAKEMHVGHLRSTIIGDTICRMLESCGCDVLRLNHIGDWGTQFGMLITNMQENGGLDQVGDNSISDLLKLYRESKERFDADPEFKTRAREAVTKLQAGNADYLKAWQLLCDISRADFESIYSRLDIEINERGESYYNPMLEGVVKDLMDRGIAERSEGAVCIFVEGNKQPLMIQKSDGGYGYGTTDMAAIENRLVTEKADWSIYVTDEGQSGHFKLVFGAARKSGLLVPEGAPGPRVTHVGFGLVLGDDGKRFRTRSSELVRLVDLLDEAVKRCATTIKERREERGETITDEELEESSRIMGYAAVKYADLKNQRLTNYKFSFDDMLSLKGNTAVYLLYAHARIAGIIRKSNKDVENLSKTAKLAITHEKERLLIMQIVRFPEALSDAIADLVPNRITDYLYELTDIFNSFYVECPVLNSPEEDTRLMLCEATAIVMRQCLSLLGIKPLYRI